MTPLSTTDAAHRLEHFGFLASPDLPDGPGPACLLVALRGRPTLRHYDAERIDYWATDEARGSARTLTRATPLPLETTFTWGPIRITDRLLVTNEYLTFGGRLSAATVDDAAIAVFLSPAPLLRRGGHSQGWDHGAELLGAFFGRLRIAVDLLPGFEARLAEADPVARYAAFVRDVTGRYGRSDALRSAHPELWRLIVAEERRLRDQHAMAWSAGAALSPAG